MKCDLTVMAHGLTTQLVESGWVEAGVQSSVEHEVLTHLNSLLVDEINQYAATESSLREQVLKLKKWIDEMQSGLYVHCVYCGHCYGPGEEAATSRAQVLYEHIAKCPEHPLSLVRKALQPVWDWYTPDEVDERSLHEIVSDTVSDLVTERTTGLKLVEFLRKIRQHLPNTLHNHSFIRWIRQESDALHEELQNEKSD